MRAPGDGGAATLDTSVAAEQWSGRSLPRKEDGRLLRGQGSFVDDLWMHRMGYAHFVRSPHAHARIVSVDTSRAEAVPGVYGTLTGAEAAAMTEPYFQIAPEPGGRIQEYCLAVDKVRFQGDAVAVVLADSRTTARDAASLVEVEYEPLPVVVDAEHAIDPRSPQLHEEIGSNLGWHGLYDFGDIAWALENADHVVRIDRLHFHRFSSTPLECFGALVHWDPGTGVITIKSNNQFPMFAAQVMAPALGVGVDKLDFSSQDIGGGFGIKINLYAQSTALALLSRKCGRPAKWTEYRTEHHLAGGHGSERTFLDIQVPVMNDGTILGLSVRALDDVGGYLHYEPLGGAIWSQVVPGCYRFKHVRVDYSTCLTNKCPTVSNRGYSRLQHLWLLERIVDVVGHELGFDPVELRKLNYVKPDEYPYETPNGCIYDSGDLPGSLDKALELIDYPAWRERQQNPPRGKRIGIGIGSTLDSGTNNFGQSRLINPDLPFSGNGEAATVRLDLYGEIVITLGSIPQGQGHETTAAQVAADILGVDPDAVNVAVGFNKQHGSYVGFSGTYASQFAVTGLGAVQGAALKLRGEILRVASFALEADEDEITLTEGQAVVDGHPDRAIPLIGIAGLVFSNVATMPPELADSVSLVCRHVYRPPFSVPDPTTKRGNLTLTYATQIHACVVQIDEETGELEFLDYAAVDDCGTRINPQIVEGQVHGAAAHGIGAVLHETMSYDAAGQHLTPNFYDYHAATALDVPHIKTDAIESPSPFSPTGAKGMGEGGGAPLHAVCSAIQDALGPNGPIVVETFNSAERVWGLLRAAAQTARGVSVTSR
jgi:CO/xanthine dehydrogenase Mo-binding subunit